MTVQPDIPEVVRMDPPSSAHRWLNRLAVALVIGTFLLLIVGGNVTSKDAGLAVPDWPLSFGSVNPEGWMQTPQVREEHTHRLVGATVGLLTTILAVWLWCSDVPRPVRRLGLIAWLAVVVQGVMGGLRVTELSIALAIVHGCFGQVFLCLVVALATTTSAHWSAGLAADRHELDRPLRLWAVGLVAAMYGQIILGAVVRHLHSTSIWHITGALVVGVCLIQVSHYVFAHPAARTVLARPMIGLFGLYALQLIVGMITFFVVSPMDGGAAATATEAYVPTLHMALGALMISLSFYMALQAFSISRAPQNEVPTGLATEVSA